MKTKHAFLRLIPLTMVLAFLGPAAATAHDGKHETVKPAAATASMVGGAFTLTDQNGKAVTDKDFDGKYRLVYFGFTSCPDICPGDLRKMADALNIAGDKIAGRIAPIFITVDPQRDTPAVMKDYVAQFHPSITGLTGTDKQIAEAQAAYKVYASKAQDPKMNGYTVDHSAYMYLMGPKGEFIDIFSHDENAGQIAESLKKTVSAS